MSLSDTTFANLLCFAWVVVLPFAIIVSLVVGVTLRYLAPQIFGFSIPEKKDKKKRIQTDDKIVDLIESCGIKPRVLARRTKV